MHPHWESVVAPLLEALSPRIVVEVGVADGRTTEELVKFAAARDCTVHGVDPAPLPRFGLDRYQQQLGERFVFHRQKSLEALPEIRDADAVLLDGDHNWYTVHEELTTLARVASSENREFPLTFLHDVDWPYARRDMYHDPTAIPEAFRQPFRKAGMVPGTSELVEGAGFNLRVNNAVREGGPRNGVRTAIEDFLAEAGPQLLFRDVVGFHGLAIIADRAQVDRNPALEERLAELDSPAWLKAQSVRLEMRRIAVGMRLGEVNLELRELRRAATAPVRAAGA